MLYLTFLYEHRREKKKVHNCNCKEQISYSIYFFLQIKFCFIFRKIRSKKRRSKKERPQKTLSLGNFQFLKSQIKTYNATIKLFASRCQIRKTKPTTAKISKYHILENGNRSQDICRSILNTDVGLSENDKNIVVSRRVIPILSPILELFQKRHNRYNYFNKLKHVITRNNSKQSFKCQISKSSLKSFFNLLLHENVPLALFGTSQNLKAIKKTVQCLLKTVPKKIYITRAFKRTVKRTDAIGASLDMQPLFNRFDVCLF